MRWHDVVCAGEGVSEHPSTTSPTDQDPTTHPSTTSPADQDPTTCPSPTAVRPSPPVEGDTTASKPLARLATANAHDANRAAGQDAPPQQRPAFE